MKVVPGSKVVTAGGRHSLYINVNGRVRSTCWNKFRQIGDGSVLTRTNVVQAISRGSKAVAVAAGDTHNIVVRPDGSLWVTGCSWNSGYFCDGV